MERRRTRQNRRSPPDPTHPLAHPLESILHPSWVLPRASSPPRVPRPGGTRARGAPDAGIPCAGTPSPRGTRPQGIPAPGLLPRGDPPAGNSRRRSSSANPPRFARRSGAPTQGNSHPTPGLDIPHTRRGCRESGVMSNRSGLERPVFHVEHPPVRSRAASVPRGTPTGPHQLPHTRPKCRDSSVP
jgi:hypothetical protein